jgi:hypothetical protein
MIIELGSVAEMTKEISPGAGLDEVWPFPR